MVVVSCSGFSFYMFGTCFVSISSRELLFSGESRSKQSSVFEIFCSS